MGGQGRGGPGRRRLCHKQHQPHLEERAGGRAGASIPQVETGQSAGRRPPPPGPPAFGRTHSLRGAGKSRFPCTSSKYLYRNFRKWYSVIVPSGAFFPDVSAETSAPGALWRLADARGGRLFCREPSRGWACSRSRSPATTLGAGAPEAGSRCEPEGGREFGDILRFLSVNPLDNLHGNADVALRRRGMRRRGPCDEVKCAVHPTGRGPWDDGLTDLLSGN